MQYCCFIVVLFPQVLFVGGVNSVGTHVNTVDRYDYITGLWSVELMPGAPRSYIGAAAIGNQAFFAGLFLR